MCGGFHCTRNALTSLNVLYIVVSFILVGVAAYGKAASIVTNIHILGGIITCGGFLFFVAILGLIGTRKHNQVLLFFFMVILFILFMVQFSIALACLAVSDDQQQQLAVNGWNQASPDVRREAEKFFRCCGFNETAPNEPEEETCVKLSKCCLKGPECKCGPCGPLITEAISSGLTISGGIGLLFSLTEFMGVWLTVKYRNLRNPRMDPSAYL